MRDVPASMLRYGSILIAVTRRPASLSNKPIDEAVIPLPKPDTTPPVMTTYFMSDEDSLNSFADVALH